MNVGTDLQTYLQNPYTNLDIGSAEISITEPPSDDSHITRMELEELEEIVQESKLPREIMRVADRDPLRLFYSVAKKKGLDPLEKEAKEWANDWTKLSFEFKLKFKRRRPYEVKKEHEIDFVVNKSDTTDSPSYPSGHAMMGYGVAEFYKSKYPLMASEWDNIADVIAHSRLQMGVHYPSDVRASKEVVGQLSDQVKVAELSKESRAFLKRLVNTARTASPAVMAVEQGGRAAVRRGTQVAKDTASAVNQGARRAANQSIEVAKRTGNAARRGATAGVNKARAAYYHPDAIQLSQKAQGAINTLSEEVLSKISQDLSVLTAVPTQNLDLIMRKGLYSQKAMLDDPEVMAAFLAQRNADKAWKNDEQYDEKRFREQYNKRRELATKPEALEGPSVFYTEPDPDKVSDPRHFVNKFNTQTLRVNLSKLLNDIPETRVHGAELEPFNEEAYEADPDNYWMRRHRDLTTEEVAKYIATDPKELWKNYKDEYLGRYYAADVPHGHVVTPSGIIPPEYLEQVEKTSSDLENEFQPDLTPDALKSLGVYDQVYGDAPSEASMKEWPEHWINKQDPLGWLQWYDRYSGGRRTDDDERQMKRWKSFKARHLAQYLKKPTPRRAAALRNWGIDVEKY